MEQQKKEKIKQAVALSYDPKDNAPTVIASGKGALAERIIEKAKEDTEINSFSIVGD